MLFITINFIYWISIKITFQILSHWDKCRFASIGAHCGGKQVRGVAEKLVLFGLKYQNRNINACYGKENQA